MAVCDGCMKSYSTTGYLSHIRQTCSRPCIPAFRKLTPESGLLNGGGNLHPCSYSNPSSPIIHPDSPCDPDSESAFFMDPDLLDLGDDREDPRRGLDRDDDVDDEGDVGLLDLETGWEPEPNIAWESDSSISWELDSRAASPVEAPMQEPQPEDRSSAETEGLLQDEMFKVPFGGMAGIPVKSSELTGDTAYRAGLHSD